VPRIVLPLLPTDGQNLLRASEFSDPLDPVTKSIHQPFDLTDSEEGLMSMANGRLTTDNLSPNFRIRAEHIQKEQAVLSRVESMRSTSTIYGSGIANNTSVSEPEQFVSERFVTVPGCSVRWYQPYDTSVSILQWSFFFSYNNWRGVYKDLAGKEHYQGVNTTMKIRCAVNGSAVSASERVLGQNMFHPVSPAASTTTDSVGPGMTLFSAGLDGGDGDAAPARGGNPRYVQTEAHSAHHFDLHHVTPLSKGYNEISLQCATLLPQGEAVYLQNVGAWDRGQFKMRGFFNLVGKLSFGIRNARVLNLL
jgi:hypothetical protein